MFSRCRFDVIGGMVPFYNGMDPGEIETIMRAVRVSEADWQQIFDDVQFMAREVSPKLNAKNQSNTSSSG